MRRVDGLSPQVDEVAGVCGIVPLSLPPVIAGIVLAVVAEPGWQAGRNPER